MYESHVVACLFFVVKQIFTVAGHAPTSLYVAVGSESG